MRSGWAGHSGGQAGRMGAGGAEDGGGRVRRGYTAMTTHEFERRVKGGLTEPWRRKKNGIAAGSGGSRAGTIAMVAIAIGATIAYLACDSLRDSSSQFAADSGHFVARAMNGRPDDAGALARARVASASSVHPSVRGHRSGTSRQGSGAGVHAPAIAGGYIGARTNFAPGPANLSSDLSVRVLAAWQTAADSVATRIDVPNFDNFRIGIDQTIMPMMDDLLDTADELIEVLAGRHSLSEVEFGAGLPLFAGVAAFFVVLGLAVLAALYSVTQAASDRSSGVYRLRSDR